MKHLFHVPILAFGFVVLWSGFSLDQRSRALAQDETALPLEQLRVSVEEGDREAQYRLAEAYRAGIAVERDDGRLTTLRITDH